MAEQSAQDDLAMVSRMMEPAVCAAPQDFYRDLLSEAPVVRVETPFGPQVLVARRAEVEEVFRNPTVFSSDMDATSLGNVRPLIPLQIDPPDHVRYRRILDPLFAPRQMALLEDSVVGLVHELVDRFVADGECDLVPSFTIPLPSQVFLTLLGLPLDDLPAFLAMKDGIIRPPGSTPEELERERAHAAQSIYDYFEPVLDARAVEPRDDLVSRFLVTEVEGERLTREEILDICFLFLIAGLDTVTASLECFFVDLATNPDRRRRLVADESLIPTAVEELLRWETPVTGVIRVAKEDVELGGVQVHAGDSVSPMLGAANLDPSEVPDAEVVDLAREANRHLAFGGGVHRCLGSHLARLELRVALREFHRRIPEYRLADGAQPTFTPGIRSVDCLPIVFGG